MNSEPVFPMKIRCLLRDQHAHVDPVVAELGSEAEVTCDTTWRVDAIEPGSTDLLLCVNDWSIEVAQCLDAARRQGIPSLVLQDGTLEWRCQYQNPLFAAGGGSPQHQPVLADKIACLGGQSARHLAAWGNADKIELTGMPRLDSLLEREVVPAPGRSPRRLLIMTAKKPWFDQAQQEVILRSLADVRDALASRTDVEPVWRVTRNIAELLGVANSLQATESRELVALLEDVDAVISTPSTALLEAMLCGRPVATLDYHNTPRFLQTAWNISDRSQIPQTIDGLLQPVATRLLFQQVALADALRCDGPAAPRVAELIRRMTAVARDCRASGRPLLLPRNLLGGGVVITGMMPPSLAALYPDQALFAEADTMALQVRLARAEKEIERMRSELALRGPGYWLAATGRFLARKVRRSR